MPVLSFSSQVFLNMLNCILWLTLAFLCVSPVCVLGFAMITIKLVGADVGASTGDGSADDQAVDGDAAV